MAQQEIVPDLTPLCDTSSKENPDTIQNDRKKQPSCQRLLFFFIVMLYGSAIAFEDILEVSNELLQAKLISAFFRGQVYLNKLFHNLIRYVFHI